MIKVRVGCHLIGATAKLADAEQLRIRVYCSGGNGGSGVAAVTAAAESGSGSSCDELANSAKRHCINL
jgi:hypothetical protein